MRGNTGADLLSGGDGDDDLDGGVDDTADTLTGGAGNDVFWLENQILEAYYDQFGHRTFISKTGLIDSATDARSQSGDKVEQTPYKTGPV